jgi:hypothetical protein
VRLSGPETWVDRQTWISIQAAPNLTKGQLGRATKEPIARKPLVARISVAKNAKFGSAVPVHPARTVTTA